MDDVGNLILEPLRAARRDLSGLREDVHDLTLRVGNVETGLAQVHHVVAEQSGRLDRLSNCVERIEQRLELITPPAASPERGKHKTT